MAVGWIGLALAAASAAYGIASQPGAPKAPDLNAASRAGTEAEAATLADRRRLEAAAKQGGKTNYTISGHNQKVPSIQLFKGSNGVKGDGTGRPQSMGWIPYVPSEWEAGGKYATGFSKGPVKQHNTYVPGQTATADFTGFGDADVQAKQAKDMAQIQLDLQNKYGTDFVTEARKQQDLADPEGAAARKLEYDLIQKQIAEKPDRPVADLLNNQVGEQLASGNKLDPMSREMLSNSVAQGLAARGDTGDTTDFADPMERGFAGQKRAAAGRQKALAWLTSGATPEDVAYRRGQQNDANLAAFTSGSNPVNQFSNLSGAQQGPAPFMGGQNLSGMGQNGGAQAQQNAMQQWGMQQNYNNSQVNPWLAGLSSMLRGVGGFAASGAGP